MSGEVAPSGVMIVLASLALVSVGACASAPTATLVARADAGSLACATTLMQAAEYEVGRSPQEVVGEVRMMAGEVGVTRELVTARVPEGGSVLEVAATAYRLEPSMHDLPVDRQMASKVTPSSATRGLAQDIGRQCAAAP